MRWEQKASQRQSKVPKRQFDNVQNDLSYAEKLWM